METQRFNPEMLALAREQRGHKQKYVADKLEIDPALISRFEKGVSIPTNDNVVRLAEVLDCPVEFFYQSDKVYGLGCSFLYHRKRKTMPVPEQRRLLAKLNVLRMQIERLLQGTELDAEISFAFMDVDQHGGPEKVANLLRTAWKLPPGPVANVVQTIEAAGGIVVSYPFRNHLASGMSWWLPKLPPLFFVNADMPGDHQRFTLMHEVGHVVMHRIPSERIEEEADRFAAEFLMPAKEIATDLGGLTLERAAGLKAYWRTSMQSIVRRALELKKIPQSRYQRLCTQIGAAGYRTNEPLPIEPEQPTLLRQLVELHLNEHGYSLDELARLSVIRTVQEFCSIYIPDGPRRMRMAQ